MVIIAAILMLLLKGDGGRESETGCVGVCIESVYIFTFVWVHRL